MNNKKKVHEGIYIDSNMFLNPILYKREENKEAKTSYNFLKRVINGEIKGYTSVLTWDELTYVVQKNISKSDALNKGQQLLLHPNLNFINTTMEIVKKSQEIIEKYNIFPRDAIHISSAVLNNISKIASFDSDFDKCELISRIDLSALF